MKGFFYVLIIKFTTANFKQSINSFTMKKLLEQKLSIKQVVLTWLLCDVIFNYQDGINAFMDGWNSAWG